MLASTIAVLAQGSSDHGFAIVIDTETYAACKSDVDAYRDAVSAEGLAAWVEARRWVSPEEVAGYLRVANKDRDMVGAVLVGDIPIAMVSRAQHMTSAFKMQQDPGDLFNTSVPTDRFYDDFDLKFDFVSAQDTLGYRYFYYNLSGFGAQDIECDIYTGRIKPTLDGEQGYEQLRKYFRKVVAEKKSANRADRIVSFTGSGSFSNSLVAWKDETVTLEEQFPEAFTSSDGARFYFFSMYPEIKQIAIKELKREDLDLALFHEHGVPDTQYVGGQVPATTLDGFFETAKHEVRAMIATKQRYGKTREEAIAEISDRYGLDSLWFQGLDDPKVKEQDSLYADRELIRIGEVAGIAPNSRITMFDACYNGDFREKDCIASSYIFSDGKAVVSLGNSVNVLQDKSSSDLLGLIACGYNVGQMAQMTNILESHIIGDPTMHFASDVKAPDFYNDDVAYWKDVLSGSYPADIRSLALYKLHRLGCPNMDSLLLETYRGSKEYTVRLQCLLLAAYYSGASYIELLKDAMDDPYEFIRRKAVYWCGETGDESFAPYIAKAYMRDYMSLRMDFNISTAAAYYGQSVKDALSQEVAGGFAFDKEGFLAEACKKVDQACSIKGFMAEVLNDPKTTPRRFSSYINSIRNSPDPAFAPRLMEIASDGGKDVQMRIDAVEALGWYVRYNKRAEIITAFEDLLPRETDPGLCDELAKTINRLKAYTR